MCGIAGLMTRTGYGPEPAVLAALDRALAHRGPDGHRTLVRDNVGLVHRRLAIIDLVTGDQPLFSPEGHALVANGEIYNNAELRATMAGAPFTTQSDCEPPLFLYGTEGLEFTHRLRGMYALAIHDVRRRRLVLARDPFGIKPLYWTEGDFGFAFASEPQALVAAGFVERAARPEAVDELLNLQFTLGAETIFPGIYRVMPGETLVVEEGRIVERHRLTALPDDGAGEIDGVLADSVDHHQRSDVPYGMFLSGGIDSSAILALMARLNQRPVLAYTAWFPGTAAKDEREHARAVARAAGAEHIEVPVLAADFWARLPEIAAAMDDPAADYAIVPTWLLAKQARERVKVVLSGEGGDEMFAGYGRYRAALRPWPFGRAMRVGGGLDKLGLLRSTGGWRERFLARQEESRQPGFDKLQAAQAADCADWLPNDLLGKLDRCLMVNGLEGRTPFLDPEVARLAFRLPPGQKIRKGLGKWALREWLERVMPEAGAFAKKRGFTVPVAEWIAARPELGPLLARQDSIREICLPGAVEGLFKSKEKEAGTALWRLLFYALWHGRHVQGRAAVGGVFDTLGEWR